MNLDLDIVKKQMELCEEKINNLNMLKGKLNLSEKQIELVRERLIGQYEVWHKIMCLFNKEKR